MTGWSGKVSKRRGHVSRDLEGKQGVASRSLAERTYKAGGTRANMETEMRTCKCPIAKTWDNHWV